MSHTSELSKRLKNSILFTYLSIFIKPIVVGICIISFVLGGLQFTKPNIQVKADPITPICGNNAIKTNPTFTYNQTSTLVGNKLYVSDETKISVIDVTTNSILTTIQTGNRSFKMILSGNKLFVFLSGNQYNDSLTIIDITTDTILINSMIMTGSYTQELVGDKIYIGNFSGSITVFDTVSNSISSTIPFPGNPSIFANYNGKLYIKSNSSYYIYVLDTATNTLSLPIYHPWSPQSFSVVGNKMYLANSDYASVTVLDLTTNTWIQSIPVGSTQRISYAIGNTVYIIEGFNVTNLTIIDGLTGTLQSTTQLQTGAYVNNLQNINGNILITNFYNQSIDILDLATKQIRKQMSLPYYPYNYISVDNKLYVNSGNNVYILDMNTEALIQLCPTFGIASLISGNVGSNFPSVLLNGNDSPNNTLATLTLAGSSAVIRGLILNNQFVPDSNQVIPSDATIGNSTGTLSATGYTSIIVLTSFSPLPTFGSLARQINGFIGSQFPTIQLSGSTIANNTQATFTITQTGAIISGIIQGQSFVPNAGSIISPQTIVGTSNAVLSIVNVPSLNAVINFALSPLTIEIPTIINQNNYSNFQITGNCSSGINVNISINLTNENITTMCQSSGTFFATPQITIYNAYVGCGVNYYDSCNYIATASQNINGSSIIVTKNTILNNSIYNYLYSNYEINYNGSNYIYNNQSLLNLYCGDAQSISISTNISNNFTQTCENNSYITLNNLPTPLPNGLLNISISAIDLSGNTQQNNYSYYVCNDPAFINNTQQTFFSFGTIRASAQTAPTCTGASCDLPQVITGALDYLFSPILASAQTNSAADCGVIYTESSTSSSRLSSSSTNFSISQSSIINSSSLLSSSVSEISSLDSSKELEASSSSQIANSSTQSSASELHSASQSSQASIETSSSMSNSTSRSQIEISSVTISSILESSSLFNSSSIIINNSSISSLTDSDNDGVPDNIEQSTPNNGDGNNDQIPDYIQPNTASIKEPNSDHSVTIVVVPGDVTCNSIVKAKIVKEIQNFTVDPDYDYPAGFVNFEADCAGRLDVKIYWYGLDQTKTYINRKYNATLGTYKNIENLRQQIEEINSVKVLTFEYSIVDNGELDENPVVGKIKDPIGPGIQIANTGGVITINAQSSVIVRQNSIKASEQPIQTPLQSQTNIDKSSSKVLPDIKPTLETIRTGGNNSQNNLLGITLILLGFLLLISRFTEQQTR